MHRLNFLQKRYCNSALFGCIITHIRCRRKISRDSSFKRAAGWCETAGGYGVPLSEPWVRYAEKFKERADYSVNMGGNADSSVP